MKKNYQRDIFSVIYRKILGSHMRSNKNTYNKKKESDTSSFQELENNQLGYIFTIKSYNVKFMQNNFPYPNMPDSF